jgi:K+-sensing histidine kinase KdpD
MRGRLMARWSGVRGIELIDRHRSAVVVAAALAPLLACAVIAPFRDTVANTNAALGLVLLVVAAAATGLRPAGISAAVSSGVWFDFFLTEPYHQFAITDRADIETMVLLVLVSGAVGEIALWGRRQQARASRREGYLAGVLDTAGIAASGLLQPPQLVSHVAAQLVALLELDDCRFDRDTRRTSVVLEHDGTASRDGHFVDVDRVGLPSDTEITLPVRHDGVMLGRFLLTAATRVLRPSLEQRQVAALLADQVGIALARADE